jgi:hypothetical protein
MALSSLGAWLLSDPAGRRVADAPLASFQNDSSVAEAGDLSLPLRGPATPTTIFEVPTEAVASPPSAADTSETTQLSLLYSPGGDEVPATLTPQEGSGETTGRFLVFLKDAPGAGGVAQRAQGLLRSLGLKGEPVMVFEQLGGFVMVLGEQEAKRLLALGGVRSVEADAQEVINGNGLDKSKVVVNLSLCGGYNSSLDTAVRKAADLGVPMVVEAGKRRQECRQLFTSRRRRSSQCLHDLGCRQQLPNAFLVQLGQDRKERCSR